MDHTIAATLTGPFLLAAAVAAVNLVLHRSPVLWWVAGAFGLAGIGGLVTGGNHVAQAAGLAAPLVHFAQVLVRSGASEPARTLPAAVRERAA